MDKDKKSTSGAPSSDTTSALFVSARKKQLEQQESERRAKEKEEQRLAAEAEVRRLEAEVEERRRKAEEEARLATTKAEENTRRIAEETRAKKVQAAENPDAVLGAPPQKKERKLPGGKKLMFIVGGALLGITSPNQIVIPKEQLMAVHDPLNDKVDEIKQTMAFLRNVPVDLSLYHNSMVGIVSKNRDAALNLSRHHWSR